MEFKVGDIVKIVRITNVGIASEKHLKNLQELINSYGKITKVLEQEKEGQEKYTVKTKFIEHNWNSGKTTLFTNEIKLVTDEAEKQFAKITMDWL